MNARNTDALSLSTRKEIKKSLKCIKRMEELIEELTPFDETNELDALLTELDWLLKE